MKPISASKFNYIQSNYHDYFHAHSDDQLTQNAKSVVGDNHNNVSHGQSITGILDVAGAAVSTTMEPNHHGQTTLLVSSILWNQAI